MRYKELYESLAKAVNYTDTTVPLCDGLTLKNYDFSSKGRAILPGGSENQEDMDDHVSEENEPDVIEGMINKTDTEILENINFRYHFITPDATQKSNKVIIMFHGFNEKDWDKYLPWAARIATETGKSIALFPIAFHMNRAPLFWSNPHDMYKVSKQRKERHPNIIGSSLSNVAISMRLHNKPQRFVWSGLQTYYDVIDFISSIKEGRHEAIEADASIDFFSYSIGTFLGQILMMTNHEGWFDKSRYATFCGGAVFNRLSPVSKFILDSEANVSLYSYLVEHLESHIRKNEALALHMGDSNPVGVNFKSMLNYKEMLPFREEKFRSMSDRFYAIALEQDEVEPPYEIINTLKGSRMNIPITVDVLDYPYPYRHENPFPTRGVQADEVDRHFTDTFNRFTAFLS